MANILLIANLNCDRILSLDNALRTGGRFQYEDGGRRLGGGGANTGMGLEWAGHNVALVSQVGSDELGDWVLAQAGLHGLDCRRVQRHDGATCEILLVMTPDGERTIIRPQRPSFQLAAAPSWQAWDALYLNSQADGAVQWAQSALPHALVVAQLGKDDSPRPCQILLSSHSDMHQRTRLPYWEFARQIAGDALRYFIVTDSERGACLYHGEGEVQIPAKAATVVDTTGAGDVYAAGLIHGLLSGRAITDAMAEAAIWGAHAVASDTSLPGESLQRYLQSRRE
ncbi:PfkB family carbohydrate kinase [Shewanella sp. YIC-542]|uniref:PfkB family carbohydrate kinase n=1 Tax=Shewanella mytili TaxID=3377111 RepID=UPI00398F4671